MSIKSSLLTVVEDHDYEIIILTIYIKTLETEILEMIYNFIYATIITTIPQTIPESTFEIAMKGLH